MADASRPLLLYVEDEPLIREFGIAAFEDAGFAVVALHSGAEAVSVLDDRGTDFKALITDIDLAPGPDGWVVAKHARERVPDLPVVYVSGGSSGAWSSMGVPGSIMVVKPYAAAQLVVAVSTAMLESATQASKTP